MANLLLSLAAFTARVLPMPVKRALYRSDPLAKLIRVSLNRVAPSGLSLIRVAAGGLAGISFRLDLHSEKDYWLGTYEPELQSAIDLFVKPGMVAYDVGANIGYITLLLARKVGKSGKTIAFEALPANLVRLRENVELNALADRVVIVPMAVVDHSQTVRFLVGPSGGMGKVDGSGGRKVKGSDVQLEIPGVSLDDFVFSSGNFAPNVIKMDIEGGEVLALAGMRRTLVEAQPVIFLECHGPEAGEIVFKTLRSTGYSIFHMRPGYQQVNQENDLDWKAYLVAIPPGVEMPS